MKQEVVAPNVGESVTELRIFSWHKDDGDAVKTGDVLLEIESDKATVEVVAESDGALEIIKQDGETVPVGEVIARIDTDKKGNEPKKSKKAPQSVSSEKKPAPRPVDSQQSPSVRKILAESHADPSKISGSGKDGRITKGDVLAYIQSGGQKASKEFNAEEQKDPAGSRREPLSLMRRKIAERLLSAQHNAAILTTFNEVDMSAVMEIRKKHKEAFKKKFNVGLGFMSFFTKASVIALKSIPEVNARIEGSDILYFDHCNIGIAVGSDRGLVVPVLKNAQKMSFAEIEETIRHLAKKAQDGKLGIGEMMDGTFTISNGGTYGSLMSTPILNPPQSGILGMHKIMDRPMAVDGKIEIRPMMYLALSYDHRIIDGKAAVTFLVTIKDHLENPEKLGLDFINEL